jgi:hypothetical protein
VFGRSDLRVGALFVAMAICSIPCFGDSPPRAAVALGDVIRISDPTVNIEQIWAHADPTDDRYILVCGSLSYPQRNVWHGYAYSSAHGGTTWRRSLRDDSTRWVSETSCTYSKDGRAYLADGESDTSTGEPRHEWGHLQLFASDDHGLHWTRAGTRADGFVDWTSLAAIPASSSQGRTLAIFGNAATDKLGHWWRNRPVALDAMDDARSISAPVAAPSLSVGSFTGDSVVLPDNTALFLTGSRGENAKNKSAEMKIYAYGPTDRHLLARAVIRKAAGHFLSLGPALVRDGSDGEFRGRLYAAWAEFDDHGAQFWLASSSDDGYHWTSRPILSVPRRGAECPNDQPPDGDIRLAVNPAGALGVLWSNGDRTVLFASSVDGGERFGPSQIVATHGSGQIVASDAIGLDEWMFGESLAVAAGKSAVPYVDTRHLGLSVRMSEPVGVSELAIVANSAGGFHAFWCGLDANGVRSLMTRLIGSPTRSAGVNADLTGAIENQTCMNSPQRLRPALPAPPAFFTDHPQLDLTRSFNIQVERFQYEPQSHIVTVSVSLLNKRDTVVRGPLSLFGIGVHSDYGTSVPLNATGMRQAQPCWDASKSVETDGLPGHAASQPIELKFRIDDFRRLPLPGDAVAMQLRVYSERSLGSSADKYLRGATGARILTGTRERG